METEPAEILPEVTKDKFYEISDSLKNTFVQKANAPSAAPSSGGGFSLLAAFGTQQSDDNDSNHGNNQGKTGSDCDCKLNQRIKTNPKRCRHRVVIKIFLRQSFWTTAAF